MSPRPLKVCGFPGCGELVSGPRCPAHDHQRERKKDPAQRTFYGSATWKKLRAPVLREAPICQECGRKPSQTVDHRDGDWTNNDPANLRALCRDCHATKSGREHQAKRGSA